MEIKVPFRRGDMEYWFTAHVENEGTAFAGNLESFDGQLEAIGVSQREVLESIRDGLHLLFDYAEKHEGVPLFLAKKTVERRWVPEQPHAE